MFLLLFRASRSRKTSVLLALEICLLLLLLLKGRDSLCPFIVVILITQLTYSH